jgi:hypothetical protein
MPLMFCPPQQQSRHGGMQSPICQVASLDACRSLKIDLKCWSLHVRGVAGPQEQAMNCFGMRLKAVV